jgi:glycosyltransferase involved in cell wall biosynthesis
MQKVCVVIPCYNEADRLDVNQLITFYKANINYYFLFVNDGSSDATLGLLKEIQNERNDRISVLDLKKNVGKAAAVREGMLIANLWKDFSVIGFLDADLSTPISEVPKLVVHFKSEVLFVFGSRCRRIGAEVKRKLYRHLFGRVFATFASNMLTLPVYDTQCGAKFFKAEIVETIFSEEFKSNWVFDLEIFYRFVREFEKLNINNIAKEISLEVWEDKDGSKIKLKDLFVIPFEMIKLYKYYR